MIEAERAAKLTRQLLIFSRRSTLEVKPLDLNEVVENLLKMLGRLIGENINVRFSRARGLPCVSADQNMIEQIIMNLAVNARDAMPRGGTLTVSLESMHVEQPKSLSHSGPGTFVCLSIIDTGCGMDRNTLSRVFEPFFTTKPAGKGTGLGLATVHGIAGQHGGWVEADSEVDKGTVFRVFLPVASDAVAEAQQEEEPETIGGDETILLVEDEANVRRVTAHCLRRLGYRVLEAADGQTALKLWSENHGSIDLLLTDMMLAGGMTGLDLAEEILELSKDAKVIIATGYSAELISQEELESRGIVRLQKPYQLDYLCRAVRRCLE